MNNAHIARVVVLTGRSTLHYLDQIVSRYRTLANWEIRVLIVDPSSPEVVYLDDSAREEIRSSLALLNSIKRTAHLRGRPATIAWRGFASLPMVRGFLLDEEHLFFGYFSWDQVDDTWKLHEQNKKFIYARQGDELSRDSIAFFKSWFDREWAMGPNLEASPTNGQSD